MPLTSSGAVLSDTIELQLGGSSFGTPLSKVLDATDISNGYIDFTVISGELGVDGSKVLTAKLTHNASPTTLSGDLTITLDTTAPTAFINL